MSDGREGIAFPQNAVSTPDGLDVETYTKARRRANIAVMCGAGVLTVIVQYGVIALGVPWQWVSMAGLVTFPAAIRASRHVYGLKCPGCRASLQPTGVLLSCPSCDKILATGSNQNEKDAVALKRKLQRDIEIGED